MKQLNPILEGLNEPQKEAVLHHEGPLLILAGAGSGKTRVITHRIANLIFTHRVLPYKICALTFTNKAANEMAERVKKLLPNSGHLVMIKTFHSLGLYILRRHTEKIGLQSGFTVYDTSLQESLIKEVVKDLGFDVREFRPNTVLQAIQSSKDNYIFPEEFDTGEPTDPQLETIKKMYIEYEKRKKNQNALDFGDLVFLTVKLFLDYPEIKQTYNNLWEYILVDEYQDTNHVQYILTHLLAGEKKNLCVVGDDDQSIYSWRGADIQNILDFEKDFPNTKVIKLEENYRSTKNIIEAASHLIANNISRKEKNLFTNNPKGEKIQVLECASDYDESEIVIELIKSEYQKSKNYNKFAIFYRTNAQSRLFEEKLRVNSIPYKIFGGFRFFDRMEIKDMIAYLSVLVNPLDSSSLLRIINFPPRGVGETTVEKLRRTAIDQDRPLYEVIVNNNLDLRKQTQASLVEFHSNLEDLRQKISEGYLPSQITESLVVQMRIDEELSKAQDIEGKERLENIQQFIESIKEYEQKTENPSLEEYLNQISLLTSEEDGKDLKEYVTLMTVHNSKGLEFDYVFMTGMENGTFPHWMSQDEEGGLEEERRLCYVAITRAREKLFFSYSKIGRRQRMTEELFPSIFLSEIPEKYLNYTSYNRKPQTPPLTKNANLQTKANWSIKSLPELTKGMRVKHKQYGVGKVIEVVGEGENTKVKIAFGEIQKNFLLAYTPLEIVF